MLINSSGFGFKYILKAWFFLVLTRVKIFISSGYLVVRNVFIWLGFFSCISFIRLGKFRQIKNFKVVSFKVTSKIIDFGVNFSLADHVFNVSDYTFRNLVETTVNLKISKILCQMTLLQNYCSLKLLIFGKNYLFWPFFGKI